jgi:hypothetical protein
MREGVERASGNLSFEFTGIWLHQPPGQPQAFNPTKLPCKSRFNGFSLVVFLDFSRC